jgi:molecular chaperone DnaK (HSP70)
MTTFGIDLGTTYSCISYCDDSGHAKVVRNATGDETTPSVVYFEDAENVVVGRYAKDVAKLYPESVVSLIKREMGTNWQREYHGRVHTPESVSAVILRKLAEYASQETGETVSDVVITVPAYFGVAEREATRRAGELAGLNVLNLIQEPIAAALHYEASLATQDQNILVFDLGGGTFDTTVIKVADGDVRAVCTDGDNRLGGADWDDKLADFLMEDFREENPDSAATDDEEFVQEQLTAAEDIKKSLSTGTSRRHVMRYGPDSCRAEVTRAELENLTSVLLDRAMDITARIVQTARDNGIDQFDAVLLVGGSSRMPAVAARLREQFGFTARLHEPEQAVAKGAARYAVLEAVRSQLPGPGDRPSTDASDAQIDAVANQLGMSPEMVRVLAEKTVTSVVPRAFGVKVLVEDDSAPDTASKRRMISHILEANRPLPAGPETHKYSTADPDQVSVLIEIWEQAGSVASPELADNTKIGEGAITRLPRLPKGSPIDVTFNMSATGVLSVEAIELTTKKRLKFDLQIKGLSGEKLEAARDTVSHYDVSE